MSRRKRFEPKVKKNSTFLLNITSMTDMFTILLVFLLQTYSTSIVEIKPETNLKLAASNSELNPVEGVQVVLSTTELKIGDRKIASVENNKFTPIDIDTQDSQFIPALFKELDVLMKDEKAKKEVKEGRILLQADTHLPYETLKKVMYTASMAGFAQLKLITTIGN